MAKRVSSLNIMLPLRVPPSELTLPKYSLLQAKLAKRQLMLSLGAHNRKSPSAVRVSKIARQIQKKSKK